MGLDDRWVYLTNGNAVEGGAVLCVNGLMVGRSIFVGNNAEANGGAVAAINSIVFMDSVTVLKTLPVAMEGLY